MSDVRAFAYFVRHASLFFTRLSQNSSRSEKCVSWDQQICQLSEQHINVYWQIAIFCAFMDKKDYLIEDLSHISSPR